ncbi:ATP synthase F1 subunit epsilon [Candidatus Uhrbacteria bacterium RIFCSPLOWO2_12_FULL_46_10]|uniref:ATP synthase epsilon chain n=1 Tax=Candidatus Uhrbacteria bacterium RIFCSPLOWO2_01_FULL_47_25 TaxID=1802402 RepID=A0A1F7UVA1_9BACT|nr:MAG: ATP synthase epsilon chain [Parcubacteria group bacterium GW2011_GWA2_46_9]OGL59082.1 MAG: ATP synthase F1 subunit epsilon [Candidatus Uhrbacteria bacterium RIFCSPHIGHO2_01_FULL_46_23]OGL68748.1 MAG: ATP synthase F1 subunit epsilon [Candidatus Uhrbacteria bacterium RIFCSPHIGHO2_02_FULL_47_29]OGL74774.1 MAG: ATP synthase F1 subunit epsilon [Candidatus Uhrbacteria bacterium RIFCSPHIGHO2_12_FULL_46_13]OGL82186.1 MAG: ATP synthase F1 subunit epsilon [Candidatus Uhrbacteria bacterium RIFCSPL
MAQLHFEITTPERTVYKEEVDQVTVPTSMGEITILPNHISLVSQLVPGALVVKRGNDITHMAVSGGFIEVRKNNEVVVLADSAEKAEEIDIKRAEEARARARQLMNGKRRDEEAFADAVAELEKSMARLKVAKRARHRGHHGVGSEGILQE